MVENNQKDCYVLFVTAFTRCPIFLMACMNRLVRGKTSSNMTKCDAFKAIMLSLFSFHYFIACAGSSATFKRTKCAANVVSCGITIIMKECSRVFARNLHFCLIN